MEFGCIEPGLAQGLLLQNEISGAYQRQPEGF
jgi:hypothetical protein